jgi:RecB family exonuclease
MYQYYQIEGWQRLHGNVHLEFGGLYATALEHFHKRLAEGSTRDDALDRIIEETLIATWDYDNDRPKDWDHQSKTRSNLLRTIVWYAETFNPDPLKTVILSDGRPAVEYSFRFELADGILYSGHIDRLVEYNGDIYIQDQKTTASTVAPYYFAKFSPDTQMTSKSGASIR